MKKRMSIIGARGFPADFPGSGGIDSYLEKIIPLLNNRGIYTKVFTRSWSKNESLVSYRSRWLEIVPVPTIKSKYLDTPIYSLLATLAASLDSSPVVWFHAPSSALFSFLPRLRGKQVMLTIHALDWKRLKWGFVARLVLRLAEAIAVRNATHIFTVSVGLQSYIKRRYGREPLMTEPAVSRNLLRKNLTKKKKLGIKTKKFILYLGRFVPEKRIELLIKAFGKLKLSDRGYSLVLAGDPEKSSYFRSLKHLSAGMRFVRWVGFVSGNEKAELLANCNLFVLPSALEGNSMSLVEALSYDRRCLISNSIIDPLTAKRTPNIILFNYSSYRDFCQSLNSAVTGTFRRKKPAAPLNHQWEDVARVIFDALS